MAGRGSPRSSPLSPLSLRSSASEVTGTEVFPVLRSKESWCCVLRALSLPVYPSVTVVFFPAWACFSTCSFLGPKSFFCRTVVQAGAARPVFGGVICLWQVYHLPLVPPERDLSISFGSIILNAHLAFSCSSISPGSALSAVLTTILNVLNHFPQRKLSTGPN